MKFVLAVLVWGLASFAAAKPTDVSRVHGSKIFHQLEASGRKNIAVSGDWIGVVWNDNRGGLAQTYAAFKKLTDTKFGPEIKLSNGKEAIEGAIVALDAGRFAAAWEQDGKIYASIVAAGQAQKPVPIGSSLSRQAALAFGKAGLYGAWVEQDRRFGRVVVAELRAGPTAIQVKRKLNIENSQPRDEQLYPSLALNAAGLAVLWEDRRGGYTGIFASHSADLKTFTPPRQLNEMGAGAGRALGLGRGSGAMRPALATVAEKIVAAVWSDKRDFLSGYDVYGAQSGDGGARFGPNQKIQDSFGDSMAQWHPAIAANAGKLAVAFDDERDGTADIWLAWKAGDNWSDNVRVPGAAGPGVQTSPSIVLDAQGGLHIVWVERRAEGAASRVRYTVVK